MRLIYAPLVLVFITAMLGVWTNTGGSTSDHWWATTGVIFGTGILFCMAMIVLSEHENLYGNIKFEVRELTRHRDLLEEENKELRGRLQACRELRLQDEKPSG